MKKLLLFLMFFTLFACDKKNEEKIELICQNYSLDVIKDDKKDRRILVLINDGSEKENTIAVLKTIAGKDKVKYIGTSDDFSDIEIKNCCNDLWSLRINRLPEIKCKKASDIKPEDKIAYREIASLNCEGTIKVVKKWGVPYVKIGMMYEELVETKNKDTGNLEYRSIDASGPNDLLFDLKNDPILFFINNKDNWEFYFQGKQINCTKEKK